MAEEIIIKDSSKPNPFDLNKKTVKGGSKKEKLQIVLTEEEIKEKLNHFLPVPEDQISYIRPGAFVRYYNKAGTFFVGGVVLYNSFVTIDKNTGKEYKSMKLYVGTKGQENYREWILRHDDIGVIFVKPTLPTILANERIKIAVDKISRNIGRLERRLESIEQKMKRIMHE